MNLTEKFKQHIAECPNCSETDPTKLCRIAHAYLTKITENARKKLS